MNSKSIFLVDFSSDELIYSEVSYLKLAPEIISFSLKVFLGMGSEIFVFTETVPSWLPA